jgi:diguanylate cyclase (GGDEF)-like protein/PAS domain S-box-containing protein/putative nucleotidyltransferase with HDIG domain
MANKGQKTKQSSPQSGEDRFRELLESLPQMVCETDLEGNLTFANKVAFDTFGYSQRDFELGINIFDMVSPEDRDVAMDNLLRIIAGEKLGADECMAQRKDGTKFPIIVQGSRIVNAKGKASGFRSFVIDISERKKTEEALRDSEEKLRTVFESMADAIVITDMELKVIDVNEAALRMGGYSSKEELIGINGLDFISPKNRINAIESFGKALESSRPEERLEYALLHKSGRELNVELSIAMLHDSSGNPAGFIAIARDVFERKRTESALRESEAMFRELFENMSSGVAVYEPIDSGKHFVFKDLNSAGEMISNVKKDELIGKTIHEAFPNLKQSGLIDSVRRVWETGEPEHVPPIYNKDERRSGWRENNIYKLPSGDVVAVYDDVTERMEAEEALRESEEKFRLVFESIEDLLLVMDLEGIIVEVNEATLHIFGYRSKDELIGRNSAELVATKDRGRVIKNALKIIEQGSARGISEYHVVTLIAADGHEFEVEFSIALERDASGQVVGIIGIAHDITERKRMEEALREREEKLSVMFSSIEDGIVVVDLAGNIVDVNRATLRLHGYSSRDELISRNSLDLIAEDSRAGAIETMMKALGEKRGATLEYTLLKKDGGKADGEGSVNLFSDSSGNPLGIVVVTREITARKRIERALRESEERYRSVIENANDAIVVAQDGFLRFFNPKAMEIMGYSRDELSSTPFLDVIHPDDRQMVADRHLRRLAGEELPSVYAFRIIDKRGNIKWLEINSVVIQWEEKPATLNFLSDITERKSAERVLQKRNRELTAINAIAQSLTQYTRLNKVLQTALYSTLEVTGLLTGGIWLLDEGKGKLVLAIHRGFGRRFERAMVRMPMEIGVAGKVMAISDIHANKELHPKYKETARLDGLQSAISIPLKSKGKTLGVINLFSHNRRDFPAEDIQLLETIGGEIGVAIENAKLLEKLSEQSETDELTGLYNRRHFYDTLDNETYSTWRSGRSFSLAILDLDGFKRYNDRFGHISGDAVLKHFANAIKLAIRKSDIAFRYGGDEFAVILPSTSADRAKKIIERIRDKWPKIAQEQYPVLENPIRFSAGIAQFPDDSETSDGLVFLADTSLFTAKRGKGYKTTMASELGELPIDARGPATLDQVYALASTVDARSPYTSGHSNRVATVASVIGRAIGLSPEEMEQLTTASLLHDIGKLGVPDLILRKPETLTRDERRVIEKHAAEGAKILSHVSELTALAPIVRHHHEWYNGEGYPERLKGEDIPLLSRIITVADSYDTMVTPLPHRQAMTHEDALDELRRYAGVQFDPDLVESFAESASDGIPQAET